MQEARILLSSCDEFFAHLPTLCWKDAASLSRNRGFYEPCLLSPHSPSVVCSRGQSTSTTGIQPEDPVADQDVTAHFEAEHGSTPYGILNASARWRAVLGADEESGGVSAEREAVARRIGSSRLSSGLLSLPTKGLSYSHVRTGRPSGELFCVVNDPDHRPSLLASRHGHRRSQDPDL